MDATQFSKFMELFQKQQEQLLTVINASATTSTQASRSMAIQTFEQYDRNKESFTNYKQRFQNYLDLKGLKDQTVCAQLLLNSIGASNYNMLTALVAPQDVSKLKYDEIIEVLEAHLCPKRNVLVAQHSFLSNYQKESESIADYIASLRRNITDCEFVCKCENSVAELFLRAQFVRGIKDNSIREQILQSESTVFDEISRKALALEASKIDSRTLSSSCTASTSNSNTIAKVSDMRRKNRSRSKNRHQKSNSGDQPQESNRKRSKSKRRVNYGELGINNLCLRCGRDNHIAAECRTAQNLLKCTGCSKTGHVKKVCIKTKMQEKRNASTNAVSDENYDVSHIVDIYKTDGQCDSQKFFVEINIEGKPAKFEVDSGAGFTFLPKSRYDKLHLPNTIEKLDIMFRSYTGNLFRPYGKTTVNIEYNGVTSSEEIYIVPNEYDALLGRVWIRRLGINLHDIDSRAVDVFKLDQTLQVNCAQNIPSKYSSICEQKIGCVPNFSVSLQLRKDAKPIYVKERMVPYALRKKVDDELDSLEEQGIITKVTTSDWGSPLVVIPKGDSGVRLCVDYKTGVNKCLINSNYPIRRIDEVLNDLRGSKYFCRLDLYRAYLHLPVDDESKKIQTITTHRGTYAMNRLSFGIKTAPSEFNRIIDQILRDIPKTLSYFDDILVHGSTLKECQTNLELCLQQLQKYNLHLNTTKCSFFQREVEYLGHTVRFNEISKSTRKIKAIVDMPRPTNTDDVRRFLGMCTYYARFISNLSTITAPLRQLLEKKCTFKWSTACEHAFITLKQSIASDITLTPFDPNLPVVLTCDASPVGIAGVLNHSIDGKEKPIAFASRSLTAAEKNYSQLDREALAIVFATNHFFNYLFGKKFKLVTDNRPLTRIFHQNTKIPPMTSGRLLRYAAFLSGFDYEVEFKSGLENIDSDCFSRAPIKQEHFSNDMLLNDEVSEVHDMTINAISTTTINAEIIRTETASDDNLSEIIRDIQTNYESAYEYTYENGMLFKGQRIIIPTKLRSTILTELHRTHIGSTKMKQLARRYVFWKNIDKDIEQIARSCEQCVKNRSNPRKVFHPWDEPEENWDRIHIDYAGPFQEHHFLICVDAKSKWAEIRITKNAPTTTSTIEMLSDIFAFHGYPKVMVADNATIFTNDQFKSFCASNGIFQKFCAPGHPATNGLAERNVQTLKNRLKAMTDEPLSMIQKVREIMFRYRATPLANNSTPAEQYLNRKIRITLDAIRPTKLTYNKQNDVKVRNLSVGDTVQARYYAQNKPQWKLGTIVKKLGKLHYVVKLDTGYTFKRHINQLRKTDVASTASQRKTVTFAPDVNHDIIDATTPEENVQPAIITLPMDDEANVQINEPPVAENEPVPEQNIPNERPVRQKKIPVRLGDYVCAID